MTASEDNLLPKVAPSGEPAAFESIGVDPNAFGGQVGGALREVGASGVHEMEAWNNLHNENISKDADIDVTAKISDIMYNPKTGFATKLGKDAVDGYGDVRDRIMKARQEALDKMPNATARNMLDQVLYRRMGYALDSASSHAAQQNKSWMIQTSDARAKTTISAAVQAYNDDKGFDLAVATARDEALAQGEQLGWSKEQVMQKGNEYESTAWKDRVERMALHDPVAANAMYLANKDKITEPGMTMQVEKQLNSLVRPREAIAISDSVLGKHPIDPNNPHANLKAQLSMSDELSEKQHPGDVEFRDQARQRTLGEVAIRAEEAKSAQDSVINNMYKNIVGDGTNMTGDMKTFLSNPDNAKLWAAAKPETQLQAFRLIESIGQKGPDMTDESLSRYSYLKGLALNPTTRAQFAGMDLTPEYNTMPRHMMLDLINLKAQAGNKAQQDEDKTFNITHSLEVAKPYILAAGIKTNGAAGSNDADVYSEFVGRYSQELDSFYAHNKKAPNDQDLEGITNRLLQQGYQQGTGWIHNGWWNGDKKSRQFETPPGKFYVPAPNEKVEIIRKQFMQQTGREPTQNEIDAVWTAKQQMGNQK